MAEDISYKFPFTSGTADVIPQPNLDMLNPMLEDLLDKFEPMEGSSVVILVCARDGIQ